MVVMVMVMYCSFPVFTTPSGTNSSRSALCPNSARQVRLSDWSIDGVLLPHYHAYRITTTTYYDFYNHELASISVSCWIPSFFLLTHPYVAVHMHAHMHSRFMMIITCLVNALRRLHYQVHRAVVETMALLFLTLLSLVVIVGEEDIRC
jgi:hypothetical protein